MDVSRRQGEVQDGDVEVDDAFGAGRGPNIDGVEDVPEPVQPGFWMTLLGAFVAVLAPLIGLLGGSVSGAGHDQSGRELALWLMIGLVIGGLGVLCAFIGALKWWRAAHR